MIVRGRKAHVAAIIAERLVVFGGMGNTGRKLNDTLVYDFETTEW